MTEARAHICFPVAEKAASFGVILVGTAKPIPTLPHQIHPPPPTLLDLECARPQPGRIFPLHTFRMFSRNSQFLDYTHIAKLSVTFPTGDCPTWVQLLHMVFLFVLEKAPDTFGQSSSRGPCSLGPLLAHTVQQGLQSASPCTSTLPGIGNLGRREWPGEAGTPGGGLEGVCFQSPACVICI